MKKNKYEAYCTGCGLCHSYLGTPIQRNDRGFNIAQVESKDMIEFCKKVCFSSGRHLYDEKPTSWGNYVDVFEGYASDTNIRHLSASGGIITSLAIFLLEKGYVDGIIQIGKDESNPFGTKLFCNTTTEEVVKCSTSRYIVSSPLYDILQLIEDNKKYAFIGRPCDIITLNNFSKFNSQLNDCIKYKIAFFCAGSPSINASIKLVEQLGIKKEECKSIQYRGDGWPGKVKVVPTKGQSKQMEYINSWNNILGRDILKICKFCTDGIGELADISTGDLWYLDANKKPLFDEKKGRNIIFARNTKGLDLLRKACDNGYITIKEYKKVDSDLNYIQPNHVNKRATIYPKVLAMKFLRKETPDYNLSLLKKYSKGRTIKQNLKTFLGTIKRCFQGSI